MTRYRTENGDIVERFANGEEGDTRYYWFEYVEDDIGKSSFKEPVVDVKKYVATGEWEPLD